MYSSLTQPKSMAMSARMPVGASALTAVVCADDAFPHQGTGVSIAAAADVRVRVLDTAGVRSWSPPV